MRGSVGGCLFFQCCDRRQIWPTAFPPPPCWTTATGDHEGRTFMVFGRARGAGGHAVANCNPFTHAARDSRAKFTAANLARWAKLNDATRMQQQWSILLLAKFELYTSYY